MGAWEAKTSFLQSQTTSDRPQPVHRRPLGPDRRPPRPFRHYPRLRPLRQDERRDDQGKVQGRRHQTARRWGVGASYIRNEPKLPESVEITQGESLTLVVPNIFNEFTPSIV